MKDNGNNRKLGQQSHSINSTWHMKTVGLFFQYPMIEVTGEALGMMIIPAVHLI